VGLDTVGMKLTDDDRILGDIVQNYLRVNCPEIKVQSNPSSFSRKSNKVLSFSFFRKITCPLHQ
jgi:hypothetical protein